MSPITPSSHQICDLHSHSNKITALPARARTKVNHRNRLDKIFSPQDDIQLIRGILKHGKKWKLIWETYDLKHINRMSLKDRARSKAFKILLEKAGKDQSILDDPDKLNLICQTNKSGNISRKKAETEKSPTVVTTPGTETSSLDRLSELSSNIDRNHLEDATINHNMVMMGPGLNYNSLDQTLSWMNMTMNLNEGNESDLINSIGCEIKSYPGELSPRLQWGDSILEDVSATTPAFGSSTMSLSSVDMELSSCPELAHYSEV